MRFLILLVALAGVVVSALALRVHYSTATAPCSINERWDCGIVNHSPFAKIVNVPVALVGILGYLAVGGLAILRQRLPLFVAVVIGFSFAFYLTLIEKYVLQVWSLYCVISQALIAFLFLLSLGWLTHEYIVLKKRIRNSRVRISS